MTSSQSSLLDAASEGNFSIEKVQSILQVGGVNVNEKEVGNNNFAAIHYAAVSGNVEVMKLLLDCRGIELNAQDMLKRTALIIASQEGHDGIVQLLLERSTIGDKNSLWLDAQDGLERTALFVACQSGHHEIVQLLLKKEADVLISDKSDFTCLHVASLYGHLHVVNLLLHGKISRNFWEKRDEDCLPLLPLQIRLALLEQKSFKSKFTALHMVALGNLPDGRGLTASILEAYIATALEIHECSSFDPEKIVKEKWYLEFLLEIRDLVNVPDAERIDEGKSHYFSISQYEDRSLKGMKQPQEEMLKYQGLRYAFDELNSYVNAGDWMERTALHYAAWYDRPSMVEFLVWDFQPLLEFHQGHLSLGTVVNVSTDDQNGYTPSHQQGSLSLGTLANLNAADQDGCTPLHLAAWKGHHRVVQALLLDARDSVRFRVGTAKLKFVADRFTIVGPGYHGEKSYNCNNLQPNAVSKSIEKIKVLHDCDQLPGAHLLASEEIPGGLTPLLYAIIENNHTDVVNWLLSHPKIDVFVESSDGQTAWTMALPEGEVVKNWNRPIPKLLQTGGSKFLSYKDESGLPPAYRYKQRLVQKALELAEAKSKSPLFTVLEMQICLSLAESFMNGKDPLDGYRFPLNLEGWTSQVFFRRTGTPFSADHIDRSTKAEMGDWRKDRSQKPWKITLFHVTVFYGFNEELKRLLNIPAFVEDYLNDREEITKRTALDLAVVLCDTKAVKMLLQEKEGLAAAEPGKDDRTPLEIAVDMQAENGHFSRVWSCFFLWCCQCWSPTHSREKYKHGESIREKSKAIERLLRGRTDVQHHVDELYRDRQVFVDAANAILVGAALIAGVTFAGWLQPPLNYTIYYEDPAHYPAPPGTFEQFAAVEQHLSVRVFWVFNSFSFFSAIATVVAGAGTVLPSPGKFIYDEVQTVRRWLVCTLVLLVFAILCVLGAFTAAGIAALPPAAKYRNNMVITSVVGLVLCFLVLVFLSRKLVLTSIVLFKK